MNIKEAAENLRKRGFLVKCCETGAEAADYLCENIKGTSVGFGGSVTVSQLGLYERLSENNEVYSHSVSGNIEDAAKANAAKVYITSANGVSEAGDIINIDGRGNRVSSTLYGDKKVYIVVGKNKFAPTFDEALWRARNIAAPKNAQRLHGKTPCAAKGDKCYDCSSPDRICNGLVVLWRPVNGVNSMEVVIINEELGY